MAPRYGSMAYKGIILVTLLALVAVFLVIRPVGAQDASIDYAENGTDPVATYTGLDPEGPARLLVAAWTPLAAPQSRIDGS